MHYFLFIIRPVRGQAFFNAMLPEEAAMVSAHFEYLKTLCDKGKLLLAGPCMDGGFGVGILQTESREEAQTILNKDPSISGNVMHPELYDFKMSVSAFSGFE